MIKFYSNLKRIRCVGVILVKEDGSVLAQLRDNNPKIFNPNVWATCGGGMTEGEDPSLQAAASRELLEETGYVISPEQLRFLSNDEVTLESGLIIEHNYYYAPYDGKQEIQCFEGQEIRFLNPNELCNVQIADGHKELFTKASESFLGGNPERKRF